ncbi:MAG: alpha/beta hydrolase [Acidimicrobiia bacterium]
MPLDATAEKVVKLFSDAGMGIGPHSTPQSARAAMNQVTTSGVLGLHEVYEVAERTVPGPAGDIPIRVFRPSGEPALPALVWFHGGGWVLGSLDTGDHLCRLLCDDAQAIVVSVDYRLAPETKFPGAVEDCVAAWNWITAHAAELGIDPRRIALGGDSAGGNLAAVVALVARHDQLPAPALQLLVYPVTDYEFERPSMIDNATGYFLEADGMRWFFNHYASSPDDFADWRMSPLRACDLAGLPSAIVITAEYDPLRDQGEAYGARLQAAGVAAEIVRADGLFHGFFGMFAFLPTGRPAWDRAIGALQHAFATSDVC